MYNILRSLMVALSAALVFTPAAHSAELASIIDNINKAVQDLEDAQKKLNDEGKGGLNSRITDLNRRGREHSSKSCQESQPGDCDWLRREGDALRKEQRDLSDEKQKLEQAVFYNRNRISVQLGILRTANAAGTLLFGCLQRFSAEAVACSNIPEPQSAAACLIRLWERHC